MKLLITTLTMIVISFGANAFPIKDMYAHCKPFQNNGFKIQNLDDTQQLNALSCMAYMRALRDVGEWNCIF